MDDPVSQDGTGKIRPGDLESSTGSCTDAVGLITRY
jgi:hypothetical protein